MGKLIYFLCFILSVFPADVNENRRHIHVTRKGNKKSHRGDTVAKIWIEENGKKKIEVCWSELNAKDESAIIDVIDYLKEKNINVVIYEPTIMLNTFMGFEIVHSRLLLKMIAKIIPISAAPTIPPISPLNCPFDGISKGSA